ncbi:site-specific DNA-methyltransferase [Eubacteriaceae bacterium Marseille-Q4139]|nr:site-specific DNA-methyltransferase [Eubacteriaceae bacterium Marseille-Q4139]
MNTKVIFTEIRNRYSDEYYNTDESILVNGDSLELLKKIPDHSIALILTDPPYHSTKKRNIVGDTSFSKDSEYIDWMKKYAKEWKRVLKHNGSVFCFCSSVMSAQLQVMFSEYFNVLSEIIWTKPNAPGYDGWKQKMKKESLRQWYPHSERIIFLENAAEGNLFKSYFGGQLTAWRKSVKMSTIKLAELTGAYGKVNHGGAVANWEAGRNIPSKEQFEKLKVALSEAGVPNIPDYEDVIRPFNVNKDVEFTDIWTFENVRQYKGKHPAEKPIDLLEHAIKATTYEGDIVLDCFAGSASTGVAAMNLGRKSILFEVDSEWCNYGTNNLNRNRCFKMIE